MPSNPPRSTSPQRLVWEQRHKVLCTVYLDPPLDDRLREQAFASKTSKNALLEGYLELGMAMDRIQRMAQTMLEQAQADWQATTGLPAPAINVTVDVPKGKNPRRKTGGTSLRQAA